MKLSFNWLKELVPGLTLTPTALAELLTRHSFETVVVGKRAIDPAITVVRIEKLIPHPNADRLRLATVTDGSTSVTVVCGAPNIAEGLVVPYAPPGTTVLDEHGKPWVLKVTKIRGVESPGMLNSLRELGLSTLHAGIFILPADTPLGSSLATHMPDDVVLEADITPNRAHDALSHMGVAKELGVLLSLPVHAPAHALPTPPPLSDWTITISEPLAAPRYMGAVMEGVTVSDSPLWLQARLLALDARPINNVVDVTNYVMFEWGNPTHAFDGAKLATKEMGVRFAKKGETLTLLDGKEQTLLDGMLVVTNGDRPVALAGIMGGREAEVSGATTSLFIEAANFEGYTIQTTSAKLSLRSEAAARFLKGIDSSLAEIAQARTILLLQELTGGKLIGSQDVCSAPRTLPIISFSPERVEKMAGISIESAVIEQMLLALGATITKEGAMWQVTPPAARLDITGEHDLAEEVIRLYGLDKITTQLPEVPAKPQKLPVSVAWREALRDLLVRWGMTETYNYSFAPGVLALKLGEEESAAIELTNPIAPESRLLRQSLLPSLLQNVQKNKSEFRTQQLFEIGAVFARGKHGVVAGVHEAIHMAGVIVGEEAAMTKAAMLVDRILVDLGITDVLKKESSGSLGDLIELIHKEKQVGRYGALTPTMLRSLKLPSPIIFFELDLTVLLALATNEPPAYQIPTSVESQYQPASKYPPVFRDVAVLVAPDVTIEAVQQVIERTGGSLVVDVDLFDVYQPAILPDQSAEPLISLAFHIKYQSDAKTLTDAEVAARHNEIVQTLKQELNAQIRE